MPFDIIHTPDEGAARLAGRRLVSAELMYKPRPTDPRARRVFDSALASRLRELSRYDNAAVLLICDSIATVESLAHLPTAHPRLFVLAALTNPPPVTGKDAYADTPTHCGWDAPEGWRRYALTDRWARILFALDVARLLPVPGWLVMAAHDAVWGRGLLARLMAVGEAYSRGGLPAAVSPVSPFHHSPVPGAAIPQPIIDALNAPFARDSSLSQQLRAGHYQAFWGKMGLLPFGMCGAVRDGVETMVWEDDLEIDRVIRAAGYAARALWVEDSALYRQALPVFDEAGLRAVIERTLHYSLPIPGAFPGASSLFNRPLDRAARLRRALNPRFARALALSERLTADANAAIAARVSACGVSWVDWGAYRYVAAVGDPLVQVWKNERNTL